jgi:cytochrome c-type biogenesis protein CcmH
MTSGLARAVWLAMTFAMTLATTLALTTHAHAAPDAAQAARIREIEQSLRCLVCQNETLADSTADLAADLRAKVVEQVEGGATDQQVRDYMTQRYGDFVLYSPPWRPRTWLLWLGPFLLLGVGVAALSRIVARRRTMNARTLSDDERRRVGALLARHPGEPGS